MYSIIIFFLLEFYALPRNLTLRKPRVQSDERKPWSGCTNNSHCKTKNGKTNDFVFRNLVISERKMSKFCCLYRKHAFFYFLKHHFSLQLNSQEALLTLSDLPLDKPWSQASFLPPTHAVLAFNSFLIVHRVHHAHFSAFYAQRCSWIQSSSSCNHHHFHFSTFFFSARLTTLMTGRFFFFFFFFILRRMGKNKALAHHTSTYFHTRRVSV